MDTLKIIEQLVQRAREERPPVTDVSGGVLELIGRRRRFEQTSLSWFAAVSAVAASVALFFAVDCWMSLSDPMMELFAPLQVATEMPW